MFTFRLKQMFILVLALTVLFGGIFFIARSISNKEQLAVPEQMIPVIEKEVPEEIPKELIDKANEVVDFGSVERIDGELLTLKRIEGLTDFNISSITQVVIDSGDGKAVTGQLADLKIGELVRYTYNTETKNVTEISIVRIKVPESMTVTTQP